MAIPDYQMLMRPLLEFAATKNAETSTGEAVEFLSQTLGLTKQDIQEMLPSGMQSTFFNRTGWASTYLKKAGLLETTRRGYYQITKRGHELLKQQLTTIDNKVLGQYPEFQIFRQLRTAKRTDKIDIKITEHSSETPLEALELAYENLRDELSSELLDKLKKTSPAFFEKVVVDLLVKMGYGGSYADAGKAVGKRGDGGIDGIIKEDKLGLDVVYIQAKRWNDCSVGRPDVMQFAGALQGQRANKGIFITTSRFTEDARNYVSQIGSKIVLLDGEQLTNLMIEYDVGISVIKLYPVKKIDGDYFDENF